MRRSVRAAMLLLVCSPRPRSSRSAGTRPTALALVRRATERRLAAQADSSLTSYRTRAHGFVFFLAQVGEGLTEPPRLVKADELRVEVYWQAPDRSKQVILGWRDGAFLPTDINYHRDHLGIVTNNFGDVIRIGEGDEVRDVPHPLSPAGLEAYDYALGDSLAIRTSRRRDGGARGAGPAALVRAAAGRRHPVPRRRDGPARPVPLQLHARRLPRPPARGHQHRAGELALRAALLAALPPGGRDPPADDLARFSGPRNHPRPLGDRGLRPQRAGCPTACSRAPRSPDSRTPGPADTAWATSLGQAIAGVAPPVNRQDMEALRVEVERIAGARALSGLPSRRLAAGSSATWPTSTACRASRSASAECSDCARAECSSGRSWLRNVGPPGHRSARRHRRPRGHAGHARAGAPDPGPERPAGRSRRCTNSLLAQEGGRDYGDYVLLNSAHRSAVRQRLSGRTALRLAGVEESQSVAVTRATRHGELPARTRRSARAPTGWRASSWSGRAAASRCGATCRGASAWKAGRVRGTTRGPPLEGRWLAALGGHELVIAALSRAPARTGSRRTEASPSAAAAHSSASRSGPTAAGRWRWASWSGASRSRCRPIPLGSFASTGRSMTVAPFLAAGRRGAAHRRPALGRHGRRPARGGRGARVVHAPHPGRGGCGPPGRRFRAHGGRQSGLVGAVVAALSSLLATTPADPPDPTTARVERCSSPMNGWSIPSSRCCPMAPSRPSGRSRRPRPRRSGKSWSTASSSATTRS